MERITNMNDDTEFDPLTIVDTLPNKPSEFLELALVDLAKVERSKKYVVNMMEIHSPRNGNAPCEVCLAGGVLAMTCKVPRDEFCSFDDVTDTLENKLCAIDYFRQGDIERAFYVLHVEKPKYLVRAVDVANYQYDKRQFKKDMRELIRMLKMFGQ
jgi:hypothetical protein